MKPTERKELPNMAHNKLVAIEETLKKYPTMTEAKAKYYVEEVLGYFKD